MANIPIDPAWLAQQFPELSSLAPLGQGGQKLVYSATHATDGDVVLKLIKPSFSTDEVDREILAVQSVQSARVPRILDKGSVSSQVGDIVWLREERIDGDCLRAHVGGGQLTEQDVLRLGLQMLEALAASEQVQIVHRDVKPDNIMVDTNGDYWLLDFGLARHLDMDSLTATQQTFGKGTLGYAPPEQFRNDKPNIDGRSDLFALGVTLHEAFTGSHVFRDGARDHREVLQRTERVALSPLQLQLASSQEVQDLVSTLTQKRRDQRPRDVAYALSWMQDICSKEHI